MLQHVHSVLIGKDCPKSYTNVDALKEGDVAVFDENKNLIGIKLNNGNARQTNPFRSTF